MAKATKKKAKQKVVHKGPLGVHTIELPKGVEVATANLAQPRKGYQAPEATKQEVTHGVCVDGNLLEAFLGNHPKNLSGTPGGAGCVLMAAAAVEDFMAESGLEKNGKNRDALSKLFLRLRGINALGSLK